MRTLALLILSSINLFSQTAAYPNAIATDNNLRVAANNILTTTTFPLLSSDTTILVANATGILANAVLTIDNEEMAICLVVGNTLTVGKSSCPNVDGRGFDNTSAAPHANGTAAAMNIDAIHHGAVSAEIKAMQTALGANLANVLALVPNPLPVNRGGTNAATAAAARASLGAAASGVNGDISSLTGLSTPLPVPEGGSGTPSLTGIVQGNGAAPFTPVVGNELQFLRRKPNAGANPVYEFASPVSASSADYIFPVQTPGGTIVPGNNSITMTPVPAGLNGSDINHLVLVGGTGTPEACLVTGGTGIAGATSGAIIVNCAGSHAAGWTIQTATAGIQEAAQANPNGAVTAVTGTLPIYGPITLRPPATAQQLTCPSWGSILTAQNGSQNILQLFGSNPIIVEGCAFSAAVSRTAGAAIQLGDGVSDNSQGTRMNRLWIGGQFNDIYVASANDWGLSNSVLIASNYCLFIRNLIDGDQGDININGNNFLMFGLAAQAAVRWESAGGVKFEGNKIVAFVPYGLDFFCTQPVCTGDLMVVGNSIETYTTAGIRIGSSNGPMGRIVVGHNQLAANAANTPGIIVSNAVGAQLTEIILDANTIALGGIVVGANTFWTSVSGNLLNGSGSTGFAIDTSASTGFVSLPNNFTFGYASGRYNTTAITAINDFGPAINPDNTFAHLPTAAAPGSVVPCYQCTAASNPCTVGIATTIAHRIGTAWKCD